MRFPLFMFLSTMASVTYAATTDPTAWGQFNTRMHEMLDTTGWHFDQAMDTKQIAKEYQSNQAIAQIKFSKPGIYRGRVSKVMMDDQGAFLVIDQGKSAAATVHLAGYQAWPWKTSGSKSEILGIQPFIEFAANIDAGQELFFQCRRVEFGLGIYLRNCLVFPPVVAATKFAPELINEIDIGAAFEDMIKARASEGWSRPPSLQSGLEVELQIALKMDGVVDSVVVTKSSGDTLFDKSAVAALKNIGRLTEMQEMKPSDVNRYRLFTMKLKPADLTL